jgi:hypothetical protein
MRRAIISIGTAEMAKYPFLPQARRHISQYEIDYEILVGMSEVRARAKKRVQASFDLAIALSSEHRQDDTVEIASFPLAYILNNKNTPRSLLKSRKLSNGMSAMNKDMKKVQR